MPANLQLLSTVHTIWCLDDGLGSWLTLSSPLLAAMRPPWEASAKHVDMYVASVKDRLRTALQEAQAQSTMEACWQKWYYDRKIGTVNLKPGNLVPVKADAWKAKRRSRISGKKKLGRWCIKSRLTSPLMKWQTNAEGHESSTKTDFFSLHQRLVFPCVWAAIIHGTGVPVPPHARLPL